MKAIIREASKQTGVCLVALEAHMLARRCQMVQQFP